MMLDTGDISTEMHKNPAERLVDVYSGRLPVDIKQVFRVAKALIVGNEVVAPVINKLAETPITKITVKTEDENKDKAREEELLNLFTKQLKIHDHLKGISFDNYGYSNAFSSIYFAPKRYLVCEHCDAENKKRAKKSADEKTKGGRIKKSRWLASSINWSFSTANGKVSFTGQCPSCRRNVTFKREDKIYHSKKTLRLIRWDPYYMEIEPYDIIGRSDYYYRIPQADVNRITRGDRVMLSEYPWPYIESAVSGRLLKINPDGFFHFKLEGISGVYNGWGTPRILSVLTSLYTVMSIVKANESTSEGRINDLTIISPQPNRRGEDPIGGMGLDNWLNQTKKTIEQFRKDRTLTAFLPYPVQAESIYGRGNSQLVSTELALYIRNIVAALGLPEDVIFSGGNYTSIAVASRILANQADNMRKTYNEYLNFIKDTISVSLSDADYQNQNLELEPYESADDFQKTNLMIQMAMAGRFPYDYIYKRFNTSYEEVVSQLKKESEGFSEIVKMQADTEGRAAASVAAIQEYFRMSHAREMAKWQALGQNAQIQEATSTADEGKRKEAAQHLAENIISSYPPEFWNDILADINATDPELGGMVKVFLMDTGNRVQSDMATLPAEPSDQEPVPPGVTGDGGESISGVRNIGNSARMPDKRPPRSEQKL